MASIVGWHRPKLRPERLIVRSCLHFFAQHWLDSMGRSARCLGDSCELCALYPPRPIACCVVQPCRGGPLQLLKLTGEAYEFAGSLDSSGSAIVGQCVLVRALSKSASDGIEIALDGEEFAREVPSHKYVAAIGRKAYAEAVAVLQAAPPLALAVCE